MATSMGPLLRVVRPVVCARTSVTAVYQTKFTNASASNSAAAAFPLDRYHLVSALVLERRPVVTAQRTLIEEKYHQLLASIELKQSALSAHELRHKTDLELAKRRLQEDVEEKDGDSNLLTAVDMEDIWTDELKQFKFASRTTAADKSGNTRTTDRKLDQCLYLMVKQLFDGQAHWVFPEAIIEKEMSTKEAAERMLAGIGNVAVGFLGNAPHAFYKRKYPKKYKTDAYPYDGAKVFFHNAILKANHNPEIKLDKSKYSDLMWATPDEIKALVRTDYWKSICPIIHVY